MDLGWNDSWDDFLQEVKDLLAWCEDGLQLLPPPQRSKSSQVLEKVSQDLQNDLDYIRRAPHNWGTQLANVAIRILKRRPPTSEQQYDAAARVANYCGIVYQFRRGSDPEKYENLFRDSLECFLSARLRSLARQTIAADTMDAVQQWLAKFYEHVPADFEFLLHDRVLWAYEARRRELDSPATVGLMLRFIEDNRDLINLSVLTSNESVRKRWEDLYRHHIGEPPPPPEKRVLNAEVRAQLRKAVQETDPLVVRDVAAPIEERLRASVRDSIDCSFEFREPHRTVRDYSRKPTGAFEAARRQVRRNSGEAVDGFYQIWRSQPQNSYAKEWYAYALAKLQGNLRQARDLFEDIRKSKLADQVTDWNLACCEAKLGDQKAAFAILKSRVESGKYIDEVLEPAVMLGIEMSDKQFLWRWLDWVPCEEAVLLAYLYAADAGVGADELETRLSTIEAIASDERGFIPPNPAERINEQDLSDLCFRFIERRMVHGGISWFRKRVNLEEHRYFYLNWRLLGDLWLQAGEGSQAAGSYGQLLNSTDKSHATSETKQRAMEQVLTALLDRQYTAEAQTLFDQYQHLVSSEGKARWKSTFEPVTFTPARPQESEAARREQFPVLEPSPTAGATTASTGPDPRSQLLTIGARLQKIRRLDDLQGDFGLLRDAAECVLSLWPASRKLVESTRSVIDDLEKFKTRTDVLEKENFGGAVRDSLASLKESVATVSDASLKAQAESLVETLGRLAADASFQTSTVRSVQFDWRLNGFLPDRTVASASPDLPKTCLLVRISNAGTDVVSGVEVHLQGESANILVTEPVQSFDRSLNRGESAVLRFPLDYERLEEEQGFTVWAKFASGGVTGLQTPATHFAIPPDSFSARLGGKDLIRDAFFVGVGIPADRRDIFHGREREQQRIANSLRGTVQSEVLFLNGPRRVGKTSILNSLKWALPDLGLNQIITVALPEEIPNSTEAFLLGVANEILTTAHRHLDIHNYLPAPDAEGFKREPISAFRNYCEVIRERLTPRRVLLMIDETQRLANAVRTGQIDDNVLSLFSTLMSRSSGVLFIFTASVLFRNIKDMSGNPIWGRLMQFGTGFLTAEAVDRVLKAGVAGQPVHFTPEAVARVWQMTEGHPWVLQAIGKRIITEVLNPQQRLVVGPGDVDQVVDYIEKNEDQYSDYWWNEKQGGFIDELDWEIAEVIIKNQEAPGMGILKTRLFEIMAQRGRPVTNDRIYKLADMQTLVRESRSGVEWVRIKGLFLERWLTDHDKVTRRAFASVSKVALFIDHENVAISMRRFIEALPVAQQPAWSALRDPVVLPRRLAQNAERFGTIVPPRYAVANWPRFIQDITAYSQAMFEISQPLGGKNTSDERLKQLVRDTLEERPDVEIYIIGAGDADYRDTIQTLLKRNKRVILWGFHGVGNVSTNVSSIFREMEQWQNLTIEYLDDILIREPSPMRGAAHA